MSDMSTPGGAGPSSRPAGGMSRLWSWARLGRNKSTETEATSSKSTPPAAAAGPPPLYYDDPEIFDENWVLRRSIDENAADTPRSSGTDTEEALARAMQDETFNDEELARVLQEEEFRQRPWYPDQDHDDDEDSDSDESMAQAPAPAPAPAAQSCPVASPTTGNPFATGGSSNCRAAETANQKTEKASARDTECSICMDDEDPTKERTWLACAHNFHTECVEAWLMEQNRCPVCRTVFNSDDEEDDDDDGMITDGS